MSYPPLASPASLPSLSTMREHILTTAVFLLLLLGTTTAQKLPRGFTASPTSSSSFQHLLSDPTSTFSFGFLPSATSLHIAVLHVPSSTPLWLSPSATWHPSTTLLFNGTLLLSDPQAQTTLHLSPPQLSGDLLALLPTSNLQITTNSNVVLWQSFDYPSDTIVQDQNFTSYSTLSSQDGRFFMRLGPTFLGLYMNFANTRRPIYFQESAWETRAKIDPRKGPLYARVNSSGYLGIYQGEGSMVHLVPFSTYGRAIKTLLWRLTMEADGNLRGYYWNSSSWVVGYEAISSTCNRPASCGAYGLCIEEGTAGQCQCLDNQTTYTSGSDCMPRETTSLCGAKRGDFGVLRRKGVGLPYKELLGFSKMATLADCEGYCERNCSCWGAIYSNGTGSCYVMDFPVETLVEEGGEGRVGYFKVRKVMERDGKRKLGALRVGVAMVVVVLGVAAAVAAYGVWWKRRRANGVAGSMEEGLAPVPYKGLRGSSSFGSVELSSSFRKQ